jgi:CobQ-like glutamine amidotransferase family enzyme
MAADLTITHLYPDLLRTYGDRGNVLTLARRAEWRGFSVDIREVHRAEALPEHPGVVMVGGGTDRAQEAIGRELLAHREGLQHALADGAVVIGICGGYQFLGHEYVAADGSRIPGIGLLDVTTVNGKGRIIGRVRATSLLENGSFELYGFENHGGRTLLGSEARPLAKVEMGGGNNGRDGTEGAVQGRVFGTYLHGPVLPTNPLLADHLIALALEKSLDGEPLPPLEDSLEETAREEWRSRKR